MENGENAYVQLNLSFVEEDRMGGWKGVYMAAACFISNELTDSMQLSNIIKYLLLMQL